MNNKEALAKHIAEIGWNSIACESGWNAAIEWALSEITQIQKEAVLEQHTEEKFAYAEYLDAIKERLK